MDRLLRVAQRARDGDRSALEEFVRLTQADVYNLCRYLGDPDTTEDLTQETFERAIRSLPSLRPDGNPRAWLLTIARRTCADSVRRRTRRRKTDAKMLASTHDLDAVVPYDVGSISWTEIDDLLDVLSDDRRAAFVLTQLLGLSYEEAGEVLGCPIGTVRSRIARAREVLIAAANGEREMYGQ